MIGLFSVSSQVKRVAKSTIFLHFKIKKFSIFTKPASWKQAWGIYGSFRLLGPFVIICIIKVAKAQNVWWDRNDAVIRIVSFPHSHVIKNGSCSCFCHFVFLSVLNPAPISLCLSTECVIRLSSSNNSLAMNLKKQQHTKHETRSLGKKKTLYNNVTWTKWHDRMTIRFLWAGAVCGAEPRD